MELALAPLLPPAELDAFIHALLANPTGYAGFTLYDGLELLQRPWSAPVADAYLAGLRAFTASVKADSTETAPWAMTLKRAVVMLPHSHFTQALEPFTFPETITWQVMSFKRALDHMAASIRLRARIVQEIPL
jgi:hypothetical protein